MTIADFLNARCDEKRWGRDRASLLSDALVAERYEATRQRVFNWLTDADSRHHRVPPREAWAPLARVFALDAAGWREMLASMGVAYEAPSADDADRQAV